MRPPRFVGRCWQAASASARQVRDSPVDLVACWFGLAVLSALFFWRRRGKLTLEWTDDTREDGEILRNFGLFFFLVCLFLSPCRLVTRRRRESAGRGGRERGMGVRDARCVSLDLGRPNLRIPPSPASAAAQ